MLHQLAKLQKLVSIKVLSLYIAILQGGGRCLYSLPKSLQYFQRKAQRVAFYPAQFRTKSLL
jgi:hypothetical protein